MVRATRAAPGPADGRTRCPRPHAPRPSRRGPCVQGSRASGGPRPRPDLLPQAAGAATPRSLRPKAVQPRPRGLLLQQHLTQINLVHTIKKYTGPGELTTGSRLGPGSWRASRPGRAARRPPAPPRPRPLHLLARVPSGDPLLLCPPCRSGSRPHSGPCGRWRVGRGPAVVRCSCSAHALRFANKTTQRKRETKEKWWAGAGEQLDGPRLTSFCPSSWAVQSGNFQHLFK